MGRPIPEWAREALPKLPKAMADTDRVAGAANRGAIELAEAVLLQHRVGEHFEAGVLDRDNSAKPGRPPSGTVAIDDPAVRARCLGDLPLGARIRARLTVADPTTRRVEFERA
jgi:exoribonuclease R